MPIRSSVMAGRFYPADAQSLRREVTQYLAGAPGDATPPEKACMVLLPHAGYVYCGDILGRTLASVALPSTLLLLGPNHTGQGKSLAVWPEGQWDSPLGPVPVNSRLAQRLLDSDAGFSADTQAHVQEHSLEVLLPFLQTHVRDLEIIPVAVGGKDFAALQKAGAAIASLVAEERAEGRALGMVVSSDMNHFADHQRTVELDHMALEQVLRMDALALARTVNREKISMCGVCPACVAICACNILGIQEAVLVGHDTSARISGDPGRVVGYAGVYVRDCF